MTKWRIELGFSIKYQKYGDALCNWPVMVLLSFLCVGTLGSY